MHIVDLFISYTLIVLLFTDTAVCGWVHWVQ